MDTQLIENAVDNRAKKILKANAQIWEYAELAFHEFKSADLLCELLKNEGFVIEKGMAGIPTCFTGTFSYGTGKPVMGILGEYDALSGLNQAAGVPVKREIASGAPGHGCGHSALGAGSLAAAMAVRDYLEICKSDGTIIFFGCPAEEGAGSKQFMARAGVFDGVDFVYTWHPSDQNQVEAVHCNAIMGANFIFKGLSAHAGSCPHLGRSALDTAELMSVGCNYLREHIIPEARIHYAYIDAGGTAPNVVQDRTIVRYEVRAPYVKQVKELFERVKEVARGAAIMMGTEMECELSMAFTEYIPNIALASVANECMSEIGAPEWSESDYELARKFLFSNNEQVLDCARERIIKGYGEDRVAEILDKPLDSRIHLFDEREMKLEAGSTDVGDVGYVVPTLNLNVATCCIGTVGHTWQMTAQTNSPITHKGILTAAKIMALACVRTMERPEVIEAARKEVEKRNGGKYICPLPDSVLPPLASY